MMKASELRAGPGLDALVAEKVMGYDPKETNPAKWAWWDPVELTFGRRKPLPGPYSTDRGAAMEVVDRMRADWFSFRAFQPARGAPFSANYSIVSFVCGAGPCPRHKTDFHNHHGAYDVTADTLPVAICRAALVALKVAEPDPEGP